MINKYSVRVDWSDADEAFVATSPEFPGLAGVNEDDACALAELREAMEMAIEVLEDDGHAAPMPHAVEQHSGQFRLRVPKYLHRLLVERAEREAISLNAYVSSALSYALGFAQGTAMADPGMRASRSELPAADFYDFSEAEKSSVTSHIGPGFDFGSINALTAPLH